MVSCGMPSETVALCDRYRAGERAGFLTLCPGRNTPHSGFGPLRLAQNGRRGFAPGGLFVVSGQSCPSFSWMGDGCLSPCSPGRKRVVVVGACCGYGTLTGRWSINRSAMREERRSPLGPAKASWPWPKGEPTHHVPYHFLLVEAHLVYNSQSLL